MNFYEISGTVDIPRTEEKAYAQTNQKIDSKVAALNERIDNTENKIDSETAELNRLIDDKIDSVNKCIDDEIQTVNTKIDNETQKTNNRIDNIIANNTETDGNSELIDIRTDINGKVYKTAGEAVRGQIDELKNSVTELNENMPVVMDSVFNKTFKTLEPVSTFTGGISGLNQTDGRYTTALLENIDNARTICVYKVTPNKKYNITATAYCNNYHGLAVIFTDSTSQPVIDGKYNILDGYDYYIGSTNTNANITAAADITSPFSASYMILSKTIDTPTASEEEFTDSKITDIDDKMSNIEIKVNNIETKTDAVSEYVIEETEGYVEITDDLTVLTGGALFAYNAGDDGYTIAALDTSITNFTYTIGYPVRAGEKIKVLCKSYADNYTGVGFVFADNTADIPVWTDKISIVPTGNYDCFAGNSVSAWKACEYEVIVPEGAEKVWVRGSGSDDTKIYKYGKIYSSKIPTKTSELVNDSDFVNNKKLPVIVFDFDQLGAQTDSRFTILKANGFTGNVVENVGNPEMTQKLLKMGFDISPYIGNHSKFDYATDSDGQLEENIKTIMENLKLQGIYNPIMISCSGHRDSAKLEEKLLSEYPVKYIRAASYYFEDGSYEYFYDSGNSPERRIVAPTLMENYSTAAEINNKIDTLIDNGVMLIMPMMHLYSENGGSSSVTEEMFTEVVAHVKELVDNGKALCMNMHEFYAYYYPEKAKQDDYIRIMSAVLDNNLT